MGKLLFFIFFFFISACEPGHYYKVKKDTASLYLSLSEATRVDFASSLDGFKFHKAIRINKDTWITHVPANKEFTYFYIVDGVVFVPGCRITEIDDFGSENCIYVPEM